MIPKKTGSRQFERKADFLNNGSSEFRGAPADAVRFVLDKQLLKRELWSEFVKVFLCKADSADKGWRGEFWGKMMRGGCLVYRYKNDASLYATLKDTVNDILATQEKSGRISSYTVETEFGG